MRYRLSVELTSRAAAFSALVLLVGSGCGGNSSEGTAGSGGTAANDAGGQSQSGGSSAGNGGGAIAGASGRANTAGDSATGGTPSSGGSSAMGGKSNGGSSAMGGKSNGGSSAMGGRAGSSGSGGGGGASPFPAAECGKAGGLCVSQGTCAQSGGKVTADPGGCHFDDGPAECCVPPAPNPDGKTCADLGGICAPIGGCLSAGGHFTPQDPCAETEQACCVASATCGAASIKCCEGGTTFKPACDNGKFVCVVGQPHDLSFNCAQ